MNAVLPRHLLVFSGQQRTYKSEPNTPSSYMTQGELHGGMPALNSRANASCYNRHTCGLGALPPPGLRQAASLCARPHLQQRARALALAAGRAGPGAAARLRLAPLCVCRLHLRQDLPQGLQPRLLPSNVRYYMTCPQCSLPGAQQGAPALHSCLARRPQRQNPQMRCVPHVLG